MFFLVESFPSICPNFQGLNLGLLPCTMTFSTHLHSFLHPFPRQVFEIATWRTCNDCLRGYGSNFHSRTWWTCQCQGRLDSILTYLSCSRRLDLPTDLIWLVSIWTLKADAFPGTVVDPWGWILKQWQCTISSCSSRNSARCQRGLLWRSVWPPARCRKFGIRKDSRLLLLFDCCCCLFHERFVEHVVAMHISWCGQVIWAKKSGIGAWVAGSRKFTKWGRLGEGKLCSFFFFNVRG